MKAIREQFKSVTIIFSLLIFFQGCAVYKPTPISLRQAVKQEKKAKVITKSNGKLIFEYIKFDNGQYYGVTKRDSAIYQVPLDMKTVDYVLEKNKTISTIGAIITSIIVLFGFVVGTMLFVDSPL